MRMRVAATGFLLAASMLCGLARPAEARSLEIRSVAITAKVNPDASMDVVERLELDFDGDFNGGTREIPRGDYRITDFEVSEDDEVRDLAPGYADPNRGELRWFGSGDHSLVSGRHVYELRYRVLDAVEVFPDVGVLNWKFIGTGFPALGEVTVDVTMPGDGVDLRAFAHGDLRGVVEPVGNSVFVRIVDNPAGSPVETRITVPSSAFTVVPVGEPALARILEEEGGFAATANAARDLAARAYAHEIALGLEPGCTAESSELLLRRCEALASLLVEPLGEPLGLADAERHLAIRGLRAEIRDEVDRIVDDRASAQAQLLAFGVAAGAILLWVLVWLRWGREPSTDDIGDYWREIPDASPALVAAIDDWGDVDDQAFATTIIDLAQRGYIAIAVDPEGHRFTDTGKVCDRTDLKIFETEVLDRLFASGRRTTVTQEGLVDEAKRSPEGAASWMALFKNEIRIDYRNRHVQAPKGFVARVVPPLLVAASLGAAGFAGWREAWPGAVVAGVAALLLLVLTPLLRARTPAGARLHAEVQGLKRFLRDFSKVDDVPVGHLALYERYLVYAVALGVAERLVDGMRIRFPAVTTSATGFAPWYSGDTDHGVDQLASLGGIGSFARSFVSATADAFDGPSKASRAINFLDSGSSGGSSGGGYESSSSGDSGGGFSSGDSGGGGGGSAGGW